MQVCAKYDKPRSILCLVIIPTRFGLYQYVDGHCDLDLKINRDCLHPKMHVCAKFDKPRLILCLVIIRTRFGVCQYVDIVTVTLTFDRLTSKSIGIIYTARRMSVPNLTNLGQFCVLLSSGQGKVYRPTDRQTNICKAIYTPFVEGGYNNVTMKFHGILTKTE